MSGPREQTTEPLRDKIVKAIWDELQRQHNGDSAFPPYVDPSDDCIDGHVDMPAVAAAVVEALGLTEERQTIPKVVGRVECTCGCGGNGNPELHSCGYTHGHFEFIPSVRWVSGWSVVGGEPR